MNIYNRDVAIGVLGSACNNLNLLRDRNYEINQNDKWYITLNFNNLKGNVKFKFDEKTFFINIRKKDSLITQRIEDKVIVLWTHKLPDGNLAA